MYVTVRVVCGCKCFMEPIKKVQVEGHLMFAEPHEMFGNLDELCYVSYVVLSIDVLLTYLVYSSSTQLTNQFVNYLINQY